MWGPILSGFTILGIFLTFSAWINGRSIKRYIGGLIKEESRGLKGAHGETHNKAI